MNAINTPERRLARLQERFWMRVERTDECWQWLGSIGAKGYGSFMPHRGQNFRAHKLAWEWENGPVPDGLVLDHLCRNRACVRPSHLEPVTPRVNVLRGVGPSAINATREACTQGHPFSPSNTKITNTGRRLCATCDKARRRRRLDREMADRAATPCGALTATGDACARPTTSLDGRCYAHHVTKEI